jgi:two-component sensor histidine kinase
MMLIRPSLESAARPPPRVNVKNEPVRLGGINVMLSPLCAHNFLLALRELATKAAKYGALSNGSGKVRTRTAP